MTIAERLEDVRARIEAAAVKAGRAPEEVKLIAVTKTVPPERIREALDQGVARIGENRVQELVSKEGDLPPVEKHLIGQLQSNKAAQVVNRVALIHSLDRESLAVELDKLGRKRQRPVDALIEVNIGGQESKGGVLPGDFLKLMERIAVLPGVCPRGLMAVPPPCGYDEARRFFAALRTLRDQGQRDFPQFSLEELSMGMSGDFEAAIAEGATFVRIGSAIFGERK